MKIIKTVLILFFLVCGFCSSLAENTKPEPEDFKKDYWLGKDKLRHFVVSSYLTAAGFTFFKEINHNTQESSVYFSSGIVFSLALGKEVKDATIQKSNFSFKDLTFDVLGIGVGLLWGMALK